MNAVTATRAKKNLESLIAEVVANAEPTIVSTDAGDSVVLLSLEEFNAWQETLYLLSNPANAAHLRQSIAEAKAGQFMEKALIE
ncbi:MAG: type II toxin-antitoxin system prevent-host-death family antitoxin [Chloroflexota bacterium]